MDQIMTDHKKMRKKLVKKVERLYKRDLREVLRFFNQDLTSKATKFELKQKLLLIMETDDEECLKQLKHKIKEVYAKNDKIKKKIKKRKKDSYDRSIDRCIKKAVKEYEANQIESDESDSDYDYESDDNQYNINTVHNTNNNNRVIPENNVGFSPWDQRSSAQPIPQTYEAVLEESVNQWISDITIPQQNINQNQIINPFNSQNSVNHLNSQNPIAFPIPAPNPAPLFRPFETKHFGNYRTEQPINLTVRNPNTILNQYSIEHFFNNVPPSIIEQQNQLLPQHLKSSDESVRDEYFFKDLPKFKSKLIIRNIEIIDSLSSNETLREFNLIDLNSKLQSYNWFETDLTTALTKNNLQIQLRFAFVTELKQKEQKDCCPEHLCIAINDNLVYSYSDSEAKDINGPFDISPNCKYGFNKITFWLDKPDSSEIWIIPSIFQISIVSCHSPEIFLQDLNKNIEQHLDSESTKSLIKLKHKQSIDITITHDEYKTRLICPLSCRRIETPCRTVNCKHIECFDGLTFFSMNDNKYDWFCPICQESAAFNLLRIDGYFKEILNNTDISVNEVFFNTEGEYNTIKSKVEVNEYSIIELDDSPDMSNDDSCDISVIHDTHSANDDDDCVIIDD